MKNQLNENEECNRFSKPFEIKNDESLIEDDPKLFQRSRSKTMSSGALIRKNSKESKLLNSFSSPNVNNDRLKMAREEAEKAIKVRFSFIFICLIK